MTTFSERLKSEQLRDVIEYLPHTLIVSSAVTLLCVGVFWSVLPQAVLVSGLVVIALVSAARLYLVRYLYNPDARPADVDRGLRILAASGLLNGLVWLAFLVAVFSTIEVNDQTFGYYILVCVAVFGLSAGSVAFYSAYPPMYLLYVVPANIGGVSLILFADNTALRLTGFIFLANMIGSIVSSRSSFRRFRDFIEVKHNNMKLLDAYREQKDIAESSSRAKSHFLAAASHDLRQPIHAIGLLADTLESQSRSPDIKVLSNSISESVFDLTSLLEVILDISKIDAGLIQADIRAFPISRLFGNIHKTYSQQAYDKGLELRVRNSDCVAFSDFSLLERIMNNLVANAVKYTNKGGVLVAARKRGDSLRIDVWDTGIGIPESAVGEVFLEYYQIGNLARAGTEGLGLGLSIVKGLCNALGYPITVHSKHHRGTVFSLSIPLSAGAEEPRSLPHISEVVEGSARILLIDDDTRVLGATNQLLLSRGYDVRVATTSDEAFSAISRGFSPDIVFCDYRLADSENGSEVLDRLRATYGTAIKGVLITADTDPQRLLDATASGYVLRHKPLSAQELRQTVADLCMASS